MGRRRHVHPEARAAQIRERAATSNARIQFEGWRWPYGWLVTLVDRNGTKHHRVEKTYDAAVRTRDEEMASGGYDVAWIAMRTGRVLS